MDVIPFFHPFTGVISGPTGCGKSHWVMNFIRNIDVMMKPRPDRIIWCYAEKQLDLEQELSSVVEFREGMPDPDDFDGSERVLIIVDDFMSECNSNITSLFTKGSHHRNISVWFLIQNFFHQGKEIRSITLNAHYILLFKNPRDRQQQAILARQMYGKNSRMLEEAYADATARPHGYLLIDLKQQTPDNQRLRTNVLPEENLAVYVGKKEYKGGSLEVFA